MTLMTTFTLAGSIGNAIETAQRADEDNRTNAQSAPERRSFDLPRWSAWIARATS